MKFQEFDNKLREGHISSTVEIEDDWIDWSSTVELLNELKRQ